MLDYGKEQDSTDQPATAVAQPEAAPAASRPQPSLWLLLRVWLLLGLQSFGGGSATLFMLRRMVVERYRWLTDEQFAHDWGICLITPGINLLSMTILVGWRVAGVLGSIVSLIGLLLPSVTITIAMTALYADIHQLTEVQSALRGVVPATVGLGLLLATSMARPLLQASLRESRASLAVGVALLLGSAVVTFWWELPVVLVLVGAGAIGGAALWWHSRRGARS